MHLYLDVIEQYIPRVFLDTMVKFCIVRNPYERMYSGWNFIKERHGCKDINEFVDKKISQEFIFELELIPLAARVHYRPQHTFVYDKDEVLQVDFIIRYETLNEDIAVLNKKHGLRIPLYGNPEKYQKLNYIHHFTRKSIDKINKLYEKDFRLFGYKML